MATSVALALLAPPPGDVQAAPVEVGPLMSPRIGTGPVRQLVRTVLTRVSVAVDDFVDALGRKQLAMRSAMTLLAAALALLLPIRLGFVRRDLARANAARDRTRAIARRRKMRVARVAVQTFGEFQDQLLEFGDPEVSFGQLPIVLRLGPIGNSDDRPRTLRRILALHRHINL